MKLFWTKESLNRLSEIRNYIARDNPEAAEKLINNIISLSGTLIENPESGRIVPEFSIKVIRELIFNNYRIVYFVKKSRVEILTVFEGHQLLKAAEIERNIKSHREN